jgi:DNA-binding beta-propeller fold protein YncE
LSRISLNVGAFSARAFDLSVGTSIGTAVSQPCESGGSIKAESRDRDGSQTLSAGDQIVVTLNGCSESSVQTTATLDVTIVGIASTGANRAVTLRTNLTTYTQLDQGVQVSVTGDATCECSRSSTTDSLRVSGSKLELTDPNEVYRLVGYSNSYSGEYTQYLNELTVSGRFERESNHGNLDFSTHAPLYGRIGRPAEGGVLVFVGARNLSVRFEDGAGGQPEIAGAEYQVDVDGDGIYDDWNAVYWSSMHSSSLFAPVRSGISIPDGLPEPNEVFSRVVQFDTEARNENIYSTVADSSRDLIYLSITTRNEVVALSAETYRVVYRVGVGSYPTAMSLSGDGKKLYIALNQGGAVAELDLDTRTVSRIDTAAIAGSSNTGNVIEKNQNLYVTAWTGGATADAHMAKVSATGDHASERAAGSEIINYPAALAVDPKGDFLFLASPTKLMKISLKEPGTPIVLSRDMEAIKYNPATQSAMSISPDGSRLLLDTGIVLRTSDLSEVTRLLEGSKAAYTADGKYILDARTGGGTLVIGGAFLYDADTFAIRRPLQLHCGFSYMSTLTYLASRDQWITASYGSVCAFSISHRLQAPGEDAPSPALPVEPPSVALTATPIVQPGLSNGPAGAILDHAKRFLYVTGMETGGKPQLVMLDLASNTVVHRADIPSDLFTSAIAISDDDSRVYFLQSGGGGPSAYSTEVAVFDVGTKTFVPSLTVPNSLLVVPTSTYGAFASSMAMIGGARLLITSASDSRGPGPVVLLNTQTGAANRIAGGQAKFRVNATPLITPDRKAALLLDGRGLQRIDLERTDPDAVLDRTADELIQYQNQASMSPDGKVLYQKASSAAIAAIDTTTLQMRGLTVDGTPIPASDGSALFVVDLFGDRLRVIDPASFQIRAVYSIAGCGTGRLMAYAIGSTPREVVMVRQGGICKVSVP